MAVIIIFRIKQLFDLTIALKTGSKQTFYQASTLLK